MTTKIEGEDINAADTSSTVDDDAEFEAAFGEFANPKAAADEDIDAGEEDEAALAEAASDDLGDDDQADPEHDTDPGNSGDDEGEGDQGSDGAEPSGDDGSDIWAKAPPELRSAYEAERQKAEQFRKSNEGRIAAFQRQVNDLQSQLRAASRTGNAAKKDKDQAASDDAASGTEGDFKELSALREDYPEIAQPIEQMFNRLQGDISRRDQIIDSLMNKERQVHIDEQEAALQEVHPDWGDVIVSPEFAAWVQNAPAHIQPILEQNANDIVDAASAADAIELFKLRTGYRSAKQTDPTPTQRQTAAQGSRQNSGKRSRQLEAGTSVRSGRGVGGTGGPAKDNYHAAFDHYADKM